MSRSRDLASRIINTATGGVLKLQSTDTTITDGSVLGKLEFNAPDEGSGTDALLVGAAIHAVAEGTFSASNNASELVFMTGASEAASSKMVLNSTGALAVTGVVSGAGFTAGNAVIAEAELELLDGLTAGTAIASKVVTTDSSIDTTGQRNLTISGELDAATLDISGAIDVAGNSVLASVDVTGVATAATFEPDGDTAAGDNAAIGYTSAEGLILTGQGSTNDITIKNDADADVITIATGTTVVGIPGSLDIEGAIDVNGTTNLDVVDIDGAVNMATTALVTGVLTTTATQVATGGITSGSNIVSDTDSTDDLGTTSVRWANLFVDAITATDQITATGFTGTLDGILGSGTAAAAAVTTLDTSGVVNLNLTTDSTSSTSGALIVDGGVGVAKKLYVGTDLDVDGTANLDVVDIDGAVNMATTALVTGVLTANGGVVFNEGSADVDFRVESNGNANMLFVDGGNDAVGIGTSTPGSYYAGAEQLVVAKASGEGGITIATASDTSGALYFADGTSGAAAYQGGIGYQHSSSKLFLVESGVATVFFGPTEYVFNETSLDRDFRVESNGNANMLFVDGGNDAVGIGTSSANAVLTTDPESGNFSSTYNNYDGVGLFIKGNGTSGNGNYGPALVFGSCDSDTANQDHKHSAISVVQTDTDPNQTGLAFWTHPSATSTDALVEAMRIDSAGKVGIGVAPTELFHVEGSSPSIKIKANNEGGSAELKLQSDQGDDDQDLWSIKADPAHALDFINYVSGAWTTRMRIDNGGVVSVPYGIELGSGLDATAANILDDYEEGTWTASMTDTSGSALTMVARSCRYTKIGRLVHIYGVLQTTSLASASGSLRVHGLPFSSASDWDDTAGVHISLGSGLDITAGETVTGWVHPNQSYFNLHIWNTGVGTSYMQTGEWSADGQVFFNGHYSVS